jgi:hypothetical protein
MIRPPRSTGERSHDPKVSHCTPQTGSGCSENKVTLASGCSQLVKHDGVPEPLQVLHQVSLDRLSVALGDVGASFVVDAGWVLQQVIGDAQDRVADGDRRPLLAPSCRQPPVLRLEGGALGAPGRLRGLG